LPPSWRVCFCSMNRKMLSLLGRAGLGGMLGGGGSSPAPPIVANVRLVSAPDAVVASLGGFFAEMSTMAEVRAAGRAVSNRVEHSPTSCGCWCSDGCGGLSYTRWGVKWDLEGYEFQRCAQANDPGNLLLFSVHPVPMTHPTPTMDDDEAE
jgi:hypothetical protein